MRIHVPRILDLVFPDVSVAKYELAAANHKLAIAYCQLATAQQEIAPAVYKTASTEQEIAASEKNIASAEEEIANAKHKLASIQYNEANVKHMAKAETKAVVTTLYSLATDCLRLSMHFFYPIQQCAQQVYHTAVPLSPTISQFHKFCLQSIIDNQLSHVTAFLGAPDTWGLLLRTIDIRPKQPTCIATSTQRIISACEDTVNIYDAVTGVLQQSLCAPERVTKIHISPDGSTLFFSHHFSVTMWDVQTGGLINTFTTQSEIRDITVSTTYIACGSFDGSVTSWNINTKEEGKPFRNDQSVVVICWSSPQELAVATQSTLYIHDIIVGGTLAKFNIPGNVWGMIYLGDEGVFLVGTAGVVQERCYFIAIRSMEHRKLGP